MFYNIQSRWNVFTRVFDLHKHHYMYRKTITYQPFHPLSSMNCTNKCAPHRTKSRSKRTTNMLDQLPTQNFHGTWTYLNKSGELRNITLSKRNAWDICLFINQKVHHAPNKQCQLQTPEFTNRSLDCCFHLGIFPPYCFREPTTVEWGT